jgi:hypothetical protein
MRVHLLCFGAFILSTIAADLKADDTLKLLALFNAAKEHSTITIHPGDYILDGTRPIAVKWLPTMAASPLATREDWRTWESHQQRHKTLTQDAKICEMKRSRAEAIDQVG